MNEETYDLVLSVNSTINIDMLALQELHDEVESVNRIISYTSKDPTCFFVHIKVEKPAVLMFTEAYYPGWSARIGEKTLPHLLINGAINGFFLNSTGEFTVVVEYVPQRFLDIGITLSTIFFVIFIVAIEVRIRRLIYQAVLRLWSGCKSLP